MNCPLCCSDESSTFCKLKREYLKCSVCELVYVASTQRLCPEKEREVYEKHENIPTDPNYHLFLNKLVTPMKNYVQRKSKGLDYGCGPGPAMPLLFEDHDCSIVNFDPYFFPISLETQKFDFIVCTEVIEHMYYPNKEIQKMITLLNRGGVLGIMTEMCPSLSNDFEKWYYKNDPSHVCFYSEKTMSWIAKEFNFEIVMNDKSIWIFRS